MAARHYSLMTGRIGAQATAGGKTRGSGAMPHPRTYEVQIWRSCRLAALLVAAAMLAACGTLVPQEPGAGPAKPQSRAPRTYSLGPAAQALVNEANSQSAAGDHEKAAATLERAISIDPNNPLLWIELGKVRLAAGDHAQAEAMGRKALAAAADDPRAQAAAQKLIDDSQRASGKSR